MMLGSSNGDGFIPGANQLWSIGTEEQFYLFWPLIFSLIKKNRKIALIGIIVAYLAVRIGVSHLPEFRGQKDLLIFLNFFNIDCMAIGGLTAMVYFHKKQAILNIVYNPYLQWILVAATLLFIFNGYYFSKGYFSEIYATLFAALILNFATNPKPIFSLEAKWTNYLGKISYGIYMYHCIAVMIVISLLKYFSINNNLFIYLGTVALTLLLASLSYHYFEEYFIRMKVRFSKIVSGDNAREQEGQGEENVIPVTRVSGI
ncbi:MAG: acyltransferase, partial [Chitinophagaceae bacterium]